jgi:hypothetical protein
VGQVCIDAARGATAPTLGDHYPALLPHAGWEKYYDPDDIIDYPLKSLNPAAAAAGGGAGLVNGRVRTLHLLAGDIRSNLQRQASTYYHHENWITFDRRGDVPRVCFAVIWCSEQ